MKNEFKHNLSEGLISHLRQQGYKDRDLKKFSYDTRYYHDMGMMGDSAWEWAESLDEQGVDMSTFQFDDFFPSEFPDWPLWKSILLSFVPKPDSYFEDKNKYKPLTLRMIEDVLKANNWNVILDD